VRGAVRNGIARLNTDGTVDTTFDPGTGATGDYESVLSLALQPDGKVLIGGGFTNVNGISRNRIARLNVDGTLDATFNPGTGATTFPGLPWVYSVALQTDGKVLIGGNFTSFNGVGRNRIARLNADGSLDTSFNPGSGAGATVRCVALQPDGKVLIGGMFTSVNGVSRNRIARLNSNGSLDTGFNPGTGANSHVASVAVQADGKVLFGGLFTSVNGATRYGIARLLTSGSVDNSFTAETSQYPYDSSAYPVFCFFVEAGGKVLIGGEFPEINGVSRNGIARLNADGSLDTGFDPGTGHIGIGYSIAVAPDGRILIGGEFGFVNGIVRNHVARLHGDELPPLGPPLSIVRAGPNVTVSWPSSWPGFALQESSDPTAPWSNVMQPPFDDGSTVSVTVPATGAHRLFRARKP
jgi:uncharacterized delta-60 repeat protein